MPRFQAVLRTAAIAAMALLFSAASMAQSPASTQAPSSDVYYEIFVRAFYDTNGDGVGDINGVTAKLDYIKSLGVSGIWLMPINPRPVTTVTTSPITKASIRNTARCRTSSDCWMKRISAVSRS